jgi:hypothetical protein
LWRVYAKGRPKLELTEMVAFALPLSLSWRASVRRRSELSATRIHEIWISVLVDIAQGSGGARLYDRAVVGACKGTASRQSELSSGREGLGEGRRS